MADLSPAAQAVLTAWLGSEKGARMLGDPCCLAAALRALADQAGSAKHWHVNEIRAIAAELEGKR
jgi:hypothetical protein